MKFIHCRMVKKCLMMICLSIITFHFVKAERPTAVFNEKSGVMSFDELMRNILITSQNEKTVTDNFQRAFAKKDWATYASNALSLASLNYRSNKKQIAIDYFKKAADGFSRSGSKEGQAFANCGIALVFQNSNQTDSAVVYFNKAISLNHQAKNFKAEARIHVMIAKIYEEIDKHELAMENLKEALDILPASTDSSILAYINNSYAEELIHTGKENEAISFLKKALLLSQNNARRKAIVLRNIGIVNFNQGNYEIATENFEKSLQVNYRLPSLRLLRDTYLKQFAAGKISNDLKKEQYFSAKYKIFKDSVESVLNSRMLSPDSFTLELKEKDYVNKLINQAKNINNETDRNSIEFNQRLTEAELERLKAEEALDRFHQERMTEEVTNQERDDKLKELEKEKASQQLALSKTELAREKQQRLIVILLAGVLLITTTLLFLYNRYRLKRKSHRDLDSAYVELTNAHRKLKETQEQLIRSEKMASLGQMTAGIAHEIQNPLNFVLNFAEVSNELLKELQSTANDDDRKEITENLEVNLIKISENGRRADAIVKNMLQHSRISKSEKTPTDLNKLGEEYFQLAYHGIRAKDSSFQCNLEKETDPNFPVLNVVQQDISRVLLNLFNNAFYAVNQKAKQKISGYVPTVKFSSEVYGNFAFLVISDNGCGIPKDIREKVFEPFFTTKPTGQGTGLGLSLSFEIIKNHGARMEMESNEGEGTMFRIIFPVS